MRVGVVSLPTSTRPSPRLLGAGCRPNRSCGRAGALHDELSNWDIGTLNRRCAVGGEPRRLYTIPAPLPAPRRSVEPCKSVSNETTWAWGTMIAAPARAATQLQAGTRSGYGVACRSSRAPTHARTRARAPCVRKWDAGSPSGEPCALLRALRSTELSSPRQPKTVPTSPQCHVTIYRPGRPRPHPLRVT